MVDIEKEEAVNQGLKPAKPISKLIIDSNELTNQIIAENDVDKFNNLSQVFAMNQKKRDMARQNRLNNLLEIVDDEMIMRFTECPEGFENREIIQIMDSTQKALTNIGLNLEKTPVVQINNTNNEIHINNSGLSADSRKKVLDVVQQLLSQAEQNQDVIDVEVEDTTGLYEEEDEVKEV